MNEKFFDLNSEKQDRMINASLHFFAKNGYKHASTDDIIKEAGISKGLLFHYFGNKQNLYTFLLEYSVRYMLFEYDRLIGDEKDYFAFHEKLELAKLNILRNYPYMYGFMDTASGEINPEIRSMSQEAIQKYDEAMNAYKNRLTTPSLKADVDIEHVETLIRYTVNGLTSTQLESGNPDADLLYEQITEYIKLIEKLTLA